MNAPFPDPSLILRENNSDIFGIFKGQEIRIEATIYRGRSRPSFNLALEEVVKQAEISVGWEITIERPIASEDAAQEAKGLLEALYQHHLHHNGTSFEKDGFRFSWEAPCYRSENGPFTKARFREVGDPDCSCDINHPISVRNITPQYVLRDSQPLPDVLQVFESDSRDPESKNIRDRLQKKLRQCEAGIINLIALKTRYPQHESDARDALYGAPYMEQTFKTDEQGRRLLGGAIFARAPLAPFVRAEQQSPEEQEQFSEHFRVLSGVWLFPAYREAPKAILANPNATVAIPNDLEISLTTSKE